MNRTRLCLTLIGTCAVLGACSSTPTLSSAKSTGPMNNATGPQEGVGDSLGYALFGESVYVAKHGSDQDWEYASQSGGSYASVDQED